MNAGKGLLMASITALMWGFLPMAAQPLLRLMNPQTLVTTRFAFAALFLFALLSYRRELPTAATILQTPRLPTAPLPKPSAFGKSAKYPPL